MKEMTDKRMKEIIDDAIQRYSGGMDVLEAAIGALVIGRYFGWHVLRLMHSSRTFAKYEQILGIDFKETFPERGEEAETVKGIGVADQVGKFWQALAGGMLSGKENRERVIEN